MRVSGLSLVILAAILFGVTLFMAIRHLPDLIRLERFEAPGVYTFTIDKTGDYRIFHEHVTWLDNRQVRRKTPPVELNLTLESSDGEELTLSPVAGENYSRAKGRKKWEGSSLVGFSVESPGEYTLTAALPLDAPAVVLTVGRGTLEVILGLLRVIGGGIVSKMIGLAGLFLVVLYVVLRIKERRVLWTPGAEAPP